VGFILKNPKTYFFSKVCLAPVRGDSGCLLVGVALFVSTFFGESASGSNSGSGLGSTVERVSASVVSIRTELKPGSEFVAAAERNGSGEGNPSSAKIPSAAALLGQDPFLKFFAKSKKAVEVTPQAAQGTGFFVNHQAVFVTNAHVIAEASKILVQMAGQNYPLPARVLAVDPNLDLAALKVDDVAPTPPVRFGKSDNVKVGESVFSMGNPFGYGNTVTRGILSARNRRLDQGVQRSFLQTDAALNPGNSGGPLFNMRGEVIGMNTALLSEAHGIAFAIPSEVVLGFVREKVMGVAPTWLGVLVRNPDQKLGLQVANVFRGSPAEKAGLKIDDLILRVDGVKLESPDRLAEMVRKSAPGKRLRFGVERSGKSIEIVAELFSKPQAQLKRNLQRSAL
jgi:serine protease Do